MRSGPDPFLPERAKLPPCGVCGYQATGYHYGVNTCEACKGFFHRSLRCYKSYICRANRSSGLCEFKPGKRKSCQYCRFQRCLKAGMSKDAIKTGRYSMVKKSKDNKEIEHIAKGSKMETDSQDSTESTSGQKTPNRQYELPQDYSFQKAEDDEEEDYFVSPVIDSKSGIELDSFPPCNPQTPPFQHTNPFNNMVNTSETTSVTKSKQSFTTLQDLSMDVPGYTPSLSSSFTPVTMDADSQNPDINSLFSEPSSVSVADATLSTASPATSAVSDNRSYTDNLLSPSMLTLKSEGSYNWENCDSVGSPHDETKVPGNISNTDERELQNLSPCSSNQFKEERPPSCTTSQILSSINASNNSLNPVSGIPNVSFSSSELSEHVIIPEQRCLADFNSSCEPNTCSPGSTAQEKELQEKCSSPSSDAKCDAGQSLSNCPFLRQHLPRAAKDGTTQVVPAEAPVHLLPSHLPQLYTNIDAIIDNLVAAHKQNIADFSQVPKDEMLKHQMKHVESFSLRVSTFGRLPLLSKDEYDAIYAMTGIDVDNRMRKSDKYLKHVAHYCRAMVKFASCIPGFTSLAVNEQANLIDSSRAGFVLMTVYPFFNQELGIGLNFEGNWLYKDEVNSFARSCFIESIAFSDKLQKMNISKEEMVLMKGMMILSSDGEGSTVSPLAGAIHWQLYQILAYITARRHGNPQAVLAQYMDVMAKAKRLGSGVVRIVEKFRIEKYGIFVNKPNIKDIFPGTSSPGKDKDDMEKGEDEQTS